MILLLKKKIRQLNSVCYYRGNAFDSYKNEENTANVHMKLTRQQYIIFRFCNFAMFFLNLRYINLNLPQVAVACRFKYAEYYF